MRDCMLDMPILMEQHPKVHEGLAALQWLPSNVPGALLMATSKDDHLCLGDADGEAMGCTKGLHGVQQLLQTLRSG